MIDELSNDNKPVKPSNERLSGRELVIMSPAFMEKHFSSPKAKEAMKDYCYTISDPILKSKCAEGSVLLEMNWILRNIAKFD